MFVIKDLTIALMSIWRIQIQIQLTDNTFTANRTRNPSTALVKFGNELIETMIENMNLSVNRCQQNNLFAPLKDLKHWQTFILLWGSECQSADSPSLVMWCHEDNERPIISWISFSDITRVKTQNSRLSPWKRLNRMNPKNFKRLKAFWPHFRLFSTFTVEIALCYYRIYSYIF